MYTHTGLRRTHVQTHRLAPNTCTNTQACAEHKYTHSLAIPAHMFTLLTISCCLEHKCCFLHLLDFLFCQLILFDLSLVLDLFDVIWQNVLLIQWPWWQLCHYKDCNVYTLQHEYHSHISQTTLCLLDIGPIFLLFYVKRHVRSVWLMCVHVYLKYVFSLQLFKQYSRSGSQMRGWSTQPWIICCDISWLRLVDCHSLSWQVANRSWNIQA